MNLRESHASSDRQSNVLLAKVAQEAERYEEMVEWITKVAAENTELNVEERRLFTVAYKNVIGMKRCSWRILQSLEQQESNRISASKINNLTKKVEKELTIICKKIISVLDDHLIPSTTYTESKIYYGKLKGDYYRYLSESGLEQERAEATQNSYLSYKEASDLSATELSITHPIRLELALSYSVFYYEICNNPYQGREVARRAFDGAITELDNVPEDSKHEVYLMMQLLRDHSQGYWVQEDNEDGNS